MRRGFVLLLALTFILDACAGRQAPQIVTTAPSAVSPTQAFRRLLVKQYRDKMMAGWLGQMVGVIRMVCRLSFGRVVYLPRRKMVPVFAAGLANQSFNQDDLYVEITTSAHARAIWSGCAGRPRPGIDFANSQYPLWHANNAGRDNLRSGIAPPDLGHPQFNADADDIDYQIEFDFAVLDLPRPAHQRHGPGG